MRRESCRFQLERGLRWIRRARWPASPCAAAASVRRTPLRTSRGQRDETAAVRWLRLLARLRILNLFSSPGHGLHMEPIAHYNYAEEFRFDLTARGNRVFDPGKLLG